MCSKRVECTHAECAKKIMKWLKYNEYRLNFTFIYGQADLVRESQREPNLAMMCNALETGHIGHSRMKLKKKFLPSVVRAQASAGEEFVETHYDPKICCGFKPDAPFEDVQEELNRVLDRIFVPNLKPG